MPGIFLGLKAISVETLTFRTIFGSRPKGFNCISNEQYVRCHAVVTACGSYPFYIYLSV